MGIVEMIREREIKAIHDAGIEEGIEKGIKKGIEKGLEQGKAEVVKNLSAANKFTVSEIADFVGVTEFFVRKVTKTFK